MELWKIIVLGAVQGLTEFLPVSSSGHLVLFSGILGETAAADNLALALALHVGSALAVLAFYFKKILSLFRRGERKKLWYLVLATVPAALVGVFLEEQVEKLFSGTFLGFGFLFSAAILVFTENMAKAERTTREMNWKTALSMGISQAVAVVPGLSRSGSTVFGGTIAGGKREEVADFSFLMSIPVILGGTVYSALKDPLSSAIPFSYLTIGAVVAFLFAVLALFWMKNVIKRARYYGFAVYLFVLGVVTLVTTFFL